MSKLLAKYNVPVPRYTSYPTVPYWSDGFSKEDWKFEVKRGCSNQGNKSISIYIHLPFCESLCTYCGCNKKITTSHKAEHPYLQAVLHEWRIYRELMECRPVVKELHLGGGTPTFFSPENLRYLVTEILKDCSISADYEFSFEGHPNNTTAAHLQTLYNIGFRRVSYGVQDNDPDVQRIINRIQPFDNVRRATSDAQSIGYTSVNFDLIYGLPLQTAETIKLTIAKVLELRPDRIAFYSYAHVPWTARGQRLFDESDLPSATEKLQLYLAGKTMLLQAGYYDIGMDHFALKTDSLYIASTEGRLFRNFMGYTTMNSSMLIGLGVSSISDTGTAYAQNSKTIHDYYKSVNSGEPDVKKGRFLTDEDQVFKHHILDITCRGCTLLTDEYNELTAQYVMPALRSLECDGLVTIEERTVRVTETGKNFIRNIAAAFDIYLQAGKASEKPVFSRAI